MGEAGAHGAVVEVSGCCAILDVTHYFMIQYVTVLYQELNACSRDLSL